MSDFIENSKHPDMTAAVEAHFGMSARPKGFNARSELPTRSGFPQTDEGQGLNNDNGKVGHRAP